MVATTQGDLQWAVFSVAFVAFVVVGLVWFFVVVPVIFIQESEWWWRLSDWWKRRRDH